MRMLTVVIPSKSLANLEPCVAAVQQHEPDAQIVVVDDGLESHKIPGICYVFGSKPFAFPRNVNIGARIADQSDIVILNDDALLKTPGGFSLLQKAAAENLDFGLISSTTNVAGNPLQFPKGEGLRCSTTNVAFVAVLVPRRTWLAVGYMDPQFGGQTPDGRTIYGWCDNDYCRRIKELGLKLGIHDGCFVDHGSLKSSFRGDPKTPADISLGRELFIKKWGDDKC